MLSNVSLKKPGVISNVWTFNGVVKVQIHEGANDDGIEIKK